MVFTMAKAGRPPKRASDVPPAQMYKLSRLAPPSESVVLLHRQPPDKVVELLGADYIFAVDIETHDWKEKSKANDIFKGRYGDHGFYYLSNPDDLHFARIVQLGWNMGPVNGTVTANKTYLIKPTGFRVSENATKNCHGIHHETAVAMGRPLREALEELISDLRAAQGARVVAHQLELGASFRVFLAFGFLWQLRACRCSVSRFMTEVRRKRHFSRASPRRFGEGCSGVGPS